MSSESFSSELVSASSAIPLLAEASQDQAHKNSRRDTVQEGKPKHRGEATLKLHGGRRYSHFSASLTCFSTAQSNRPRPRRDSQFDICRAKAFQAVESHVAKPSWNRTRHRHILTHPARKRDFGVAARSSRLPQQATLGTTGKGGPRAAPAPKVALRTLSDTYYNSSMP